MFDKIFKAYDIRGVYPDQLNESTATSIGYAAGKFLLQQLTDTQLADPKFKSIVVGRDMRVSSPDMADALIKGIVASGANVIDVGMIDTSFIYFAVNHLNCCGGIQTTASHNPPQYNGFKISGQLAKPIGADTGLNEIKKIAIQTNPATLSTIGEIRQQDLWNQYKAHVLQFLNLKRPLTVAVDASNGMAGYFMPRIFADIPNLKIIPINYETTGEFVHAPNPLVPENMRQTQNAVKQHNADLGVCFDGDADRCMVTDEQANIVGCDLLGALFAEYFLNKSPESSIAYDLRASKSLPLHIEAAGGKPLRSRVGHVFMKKILRDNDAIFGAELSGHMYYRDNFYADSGAITFALAISLLSSQPKPMSQLIDKYALYVQSGELNFQVEDKDAMIEQLRDTYTDIAEIDDLDGITVDAMAGENWWFNVRKSNTEPLLRLNLEARDKSTLKEMLSQLINMLGQPIQGH